MGLKSACAKGFVESGGGTGINVMGQYRPCYKSFAKQKINRRPEQEEIKEVEDYAVKKGLRIIN